jgi:dual specificity tyrosine-phosphorylation-regulated kinase 2/3/4
MGLVYDQAVDMWSFGCILCELCTGRPLFPAVDENELLEFFRMRIGMPSKDMIQNCRKRKVFFDRNNRLIPSKNSRLPEGSRERSCTIREALFSEEDPDFLHFIEVS